MFIKAVSDTVFDMHDKCRLSRQAFDIYQGYTFEFIKAVSDTVFDMINADYYDKPLILSGLHFRRSSSPIIGQ